MASNHEYPDLSLARADMQEQSTLYRPTAFWDRASAAIVDELCQHGIDNFRALPKPLSFFVPTYGVPGNCYTTAQSDGLKTWLKDSFPAAVKAQLGLEQYLTGQMAATGDYRTLLAADDPSRRPFLDKFSECDYGSPVEQFELEGRQFSRSSLNYLLGLAMLKKHLGGEEISNVLEIGGGFGTLGEVLASAGIPGLRYVDVDIPPTSYVAECYLKAALGESNVTGYAATRSLETIQISELPMASVLCSWQIEKLQGQIDLFVNFISFQEMEPDVVNNYLSHVRRLGTRWVLLRNIREGKRKRTSEHEVGVETPILGDDYATMLPGYSLVERSVHPYGFRTVDGFHSELFLFQKQS
jgi:putative sugar O-methyltransferase